MTCIMQMLSPPILYALTHTKRGEPGQAAGPHVQIMQSQGSAGCSKDIKKTRYWEHQSFNSFIPKKKQNIYYVGDGSSFFMTWETSGEFSKDSFLVNSELPGKAWGQCIALIYDNYSDIFDIVLSFCGGVLVFKVDKCSMLCSNA